MFSHPQGEEMKSLPQRCIPCAVRIYLYMMDKKENHKSFLLILALSHGPVRDDVEAYIGK